MNALELIKAGRPDEALKALEGDVRKNPADAKLRMFLFQLLSVLGHWDRALNQLNVAAEMDSKNLLDAELYRPAIQCEAFRKEVFAGTRIPLVFGEPEEWVGWMIQANQLQGQGKFEAAVELRNKALDAAPTVSGFVDTSPFAWVMDADPRLGPMFEVILNGKYFWVPMSRVASVKIDPPAELRDVVWTMAHFRWTNGGEAPALIPTRYPGSESSDARHQLARQTDWNEPAPGLQVGLGQRLIATETGDHALLEIRNLSTIVEPGAPSAAPADAEGDHA